MGVVWSAVDNRDAFEIRDKSVAAEAALAAGAELTAEQQDDIDAWVELQEDRKPDRAEIERDIAAHQGGYLDVMSHQAEDNAEQESWGIYRYFFDFFP